MNAIAITSQMQVRQGPITMRSELASLMASVCADIHADRYMLVHPSVERGPKSVRIITSNWIFDALEDFGSVGIASIIENGHPSGPGATPRALAPATAPFLSKEEKRALLHHGHGELYCQKLIAGGTVSFAIFSAAAARCIDPLALRRGHMMCSYAVSQYFSATGAQESNDPLSERERECLLWVSEGKTTDEVALILGVSSNTVNSYIANAIQKFGANNRAMAIATAIRSGII